jgi:hypothetical protein
MAGQNTSVVKMKEHLKTSLLVTKRYKNNYPHYRLALIINRLQYGYAFLPEFVRKFLHSNLIFLKRFIFG